MRVLFVCTVNRLRSPTAETLFSTFPGVEALSAGTDSSATTPLTPELIASVDVIFAMEKQHRDKIRKRYKVRPADGRIFTLNIPDEYERDDPELIELLKSKVSLRLEHLVSSES